MLPSLHTLALEPRPGKPGKPGRPETLGPGASPSSTGGTFGRRTAEFVARRGHEHVHEHHRSRVQEMLHEKGMTWATANPELLRYAWQYLFARYRDENKSPPLPKAVKDKAKDLIYDYEGPRKQLEHARGAPLNAKAYHCEVTFDSPDAWEIDAHKEHWWLLRHVRDNTHPIDYNVKMLLHDLGRDATYFKYGEKTNETVNAYYAEKIGWSEGVAQPKDDAVVYDAFGGEPSDDAWHHWLDDRTWAKSVHVGHDSFYGIGLYWRIEAELYDYLANAQPSGRTTPFRSADGTMVMAAPWILELSKDADTARIEPRAFFEKILKMAVLRPAKVDLTCLQEKETTTPFARLFGAERFGYRARYLMPEGYESFMPSCDDTWPDYKVPKGGGDGS